MSQSSAVTEPLPPVEARAAPADLSYTGGDTLADGLIAHGVDTVFGLPGAQMYTLFDALARRADELRTILSRHEQGAAYMAFGFAQATGRPGVYTVVPGPGVLNTTAALCTAWGCNQPVLCLTGQVPSSFLGQGRGHLHELPDQQATLASLVKWAGRAETADQASTAVAEAFRQMQSARPGPASLEMCWDAMIAPAARAICAPLPCAKPPEPDDAALRDAARRLASARAPLIFVGGGARHAAPEIQELARVLNAPVASFRSGRGVMPDDDPLGLTCASAFPLWADTDVVLAIGTRLELPLMRWGGWMHRADRLPAGKTLIRIDIDPAESARIHADVNLLTDARLGAAALASAVRQFVQTRRRSLDDIATVKQETVKAIQSVQPQMAYLAAIRDVLPRDGIFVEEVSQVGFAANYGFPVYAPRTYITCGFQGTLGFGYPTSLGVKAGVGDRAVVSITGDGGFLFGINELPSSVQNKLNSVTVLFNNKCFQNVRRDQKRLFENRTFCDELVNPDFVKLGESCGVATERVKTPTALQSALETALAADAPRLIEVASDTDSDASPWPFLMPRLY
jgi:acetolactate synthase I/II/III large subunit